ncbi:inositol monophosphatase family protein [Ornithinimicrobium faecis]|uniref:Inositol-phosphate phosphatase n=1 Tax=Ornithinimicrobium faecis TaxID=2934158 RepID=A0ABY4YSC6_9MICO|nr:MULTISPECIES: inositol monophosphatase family protein [unclassified Ornithinimicrobium]USQ79263.1 inositol-phosphate phosphatase [Ornithinimicrobium sp. HY1793]
MAIPMSTETFLADPVLAAARDAAHIACSRMVHWRTRLDGAVVSAKGDPNDLVTVADREIEALVTGHLHRHRPDDVVIGEEGVAALSLDDLPGGAEIAAGLRGCGAGDSPRIEWHVDPIDGTVNFVRGLEQHCFSIGARDLTTGEWLAGLVAAPALHSVWFARAGQGAWRTGALPGSTTPAPPFVRLAGTPAGRRGQVVATGFGYSPALRAIQLTALPEVMEGFDDLRRSGSAALDLCAAAEGRVNAYFERDLGVYDWAAGTLIAEEAGLAVQRPSGPGELTIVADTADRLEFLRARA